MILDFRTFECIQEMNRYFPYEYCDHPLVEDIVRMRQCSYMDPIEEGLISTYPADAVIRYVCKKFGIENEGEQDKDYIPAAISFTRLKRSFRIHLNPGFYTEHKEDLDVILNACGYYYSITSDRYVVFEKKFDSEVSDELRNCGQKYLYHVSPSVNARKILDMGLVPKSKNMRFNYPDRIYLFGKGGETDDKFLLHMCKMLLQSATDAYYRKNGYDDEATKSELKRRGLLEFSVFRIDVNKIDNRIFEDPNCENFDSYYVKDNIRPEYIEDTGKKFTFNVK